MGLAEVCRTLYEQSPLDDFLEAVEKLFQFGGQADRAYVDLPVIGHLRFQTFAVAVERRGCVWQPKAAEKAAYAQLLAWLQAGAREFPQATHIMWRKQPEWQDSRLYARLAVFSSEGQHMLAGAKAEGERMPYICVNPLKECA